MEQNRRATRKRKKFNWSNLAVVILSLSILTVTIAVITDFIQQERIKVASVSVKIDNEQVEQDIYLQSEAKEAEYFTSYITYPYTKIEAIDVPIKQFVSEQEQKFYEEMDTINDMMGESFQSHFSLQTEFVKVNDHQYQLILKTEQLVEKNNEFNQVHTFIIDVDEEKIIKWADVFYPEDNSELYGVLLELFKETDALNEDSLHQLLSNNNVPWSFDEEQLLIHFNPGELEDNNEIIVKEIPLTSIYPFINETYESMILSEKVVKEIARIEEEKRKEEEKQQDEDDSSNTPPASLGGKKYIALTFDDGPHGVVTERILSTLDQYNAKATFFMLGQNAASMPTIAKKVADKGHEIANHSITHANLRAVSAERVHKEMVTSLDQIEQATGIRPTLFRPPYGNHNENVQNKAKESNQKLILWSVDTRDWESLNANSVYQSVQTYARPGSIILLHDIHPTTAEALPQIMQYLTNNGFEFVTVSELLPYVEGSGIGPYYGY